MARIVFLGTSEFALPILEALAHHHQVAAVYTQPDRPSGRGQRLAPPPVKAKAQELGLPVRQPRQLRGPGVVEALAELKPQALAVAAYGQLLPQRVLALPPRGCLNVHPSLLPRHRGPSPVQGALLAGDRETGVSIMLLDAGMDTGPILAQRPYPISPGETGGSLALALAHLGAALLLETLPPWLEGKTEPQPQDEAEATYTHLLTKAEGAINWHLPAQELERRARAFQPWPGAYTFWQGKLLKVLEATPILTTGGGVPGRVTPLPGPDLSGGVETGHGTLELRRVQLEGKKPLPIKEFLQGHRGFLGSVLGPMPPPRPPL